jgi:hypothetical protein
MKMKYLSILLVLAALAVPARAEMDDVTYTLSAITTNQASAAYVVRGQIEAINAVIPANKTATVTIATASGVTIFSKAMTSATDGYFPVLVPAYTTAGAAITEVIDGSTNTVYTKLGVAEKVTATVEPAANTTGTNTYTATIIVKK